VVVLVIPTKGDSLNKRPVVDAIQDYSSKLHVSLTVVETPGDESSRKQSLCQSIGGGMRKESPSGQKQVIYGNGSNGNEKKPMTPDLIINTDSQASAALRDVATILNIPLVSVTDDDPRDHSANDAISPSDRISDSLKDSMLEGMVTNKRVVMVKSPSRILMESVRDAVAHFGLRNNLIRVLYDQEYGESFCNARQDTTDSFMHELRTKGMKQIQEQRTGSIN
jgi:hypothetical protein